MGKLKTKAGDKDNAAANAPTNRIDGPVADPSKGDAKTDDAKSTDASQVNEAKSNDEIKAKQEIAAKEKAESEAKAEREIAAVEKKRLKDEAAGIFVQDEGKDFVEIVLKREWVLHDVPQQKGLKLGKVVLEKETTLNYIVCALAKGLAKCDGPRVYLSKAASVGNIKAPVGHTLAMVRSDLGAQVLGKMIDAGIAGQLKTK